MENIITEQTNDHNAIHTKRSVLKNLFFSMLGFGLIIGLIFPFFAWVILKTDAALSLSFFMICVIAGLTVGFFNHFIFRIIVSKELTHIQNGMHYVYKNISTVNILDHNCQDDCLLEVTSADIIGDITVTFNNMTQQIFNRLVTEVETNSLIEELSTSFELNDVAKIILYKMADVVNAKGGLIYGGSIEKMDLLVDFGIDHSDSLLHTLSEDLGPVNLTLSSDVIQTFSKDDGWRWLNQSTPLFEIEPNTVLLVPLLANQRPVGLVLLVSNAQKPDETQLQRLETIRNFTSPHLDNSLLHNRIKELAAIDELTGILNRRFGMRRLQEEYSRAIRHGIPLSVLMIDIDHFKDFNDTYGHALGDAVLKAVASKLQTSIRAEDMACRYGGEEFLVYLSGAGMTDSAEIAERFRRNISTEAIKLGNNIVSISVSIGIATFPIVRSSIPKELIDFADEALYAAKNAGRNQVIVNDGVRMIPYAELMSS